MWISEIRKLSDADWLDLIRTLVPQGSFQAFGIDPQSFQDCEGRLRLRVLYREHGRILNVRITAPAGEVDPIYSIFLKEFGEDGVDVIGLNINDPSSRRFQVDLDEYGRIPADLLSWRRNVGEEIEAMKAGLAPGQVRKGLRWVGAALEGIEAFCARTGRRWIYCEAMAYHNAMIFERHGFGYQFKTWEDEMRWIDAEFRPPHGLFFNRLDGSTPFRQPGMEASVRGRSWAIHDGIMGRPWNRPMMIKEVGVHSQVNTFEGGTY